MVQFALKLEDNRVDKWKDYYLDYKQLKKHILATARWGAREREKARAAARAAVLKKAEQGPPGPTAPSAGAEERTALLLKARVGAPSVQRGPALSDKISPTRSHSRTASAEEENVTFEALFLSEVEKVEKFFLQTVDQLWQQLSAALSRTPEQAGHMSQRRISMGEDYAGSDSDSEGPPPGSPPSPRKPPLRSHSKSFTIADKHTAESVRRALMDLYRDMTLLKNFSIVNYTACVKILKKHDKKAAFVEGPLYDKLLPHVQKQDFHKCRRLDSIMTQCELEFSRLFCGGSHELARGLLLPQKTDEQLDLGQLQLGYHLGIAATLAFWVLWDCVVQVLGSGGQEHSITEQPAFEVYRGLAGLLLLHWCWGVSVVVWTRARINYIYLFELDPRHMWDPRQTFNECAKDTMMYFGNLLLYYKVLVKRFPAFIPAGYYPLTLCAYFAYKLARPVRRHKDLWRVLRRVVCAPFFKVDFFSTYVADVLTSSVKILQDLAWTVCYFASGDFLLSRADFDRSGSRWQQTVTYGHVVLPLLTVIPLWLRFQQCLRRYYDTNRRKNNLANALKYAMAQTVSMFGVLRPSRHVRSFYEGVWVTLYCVSSMYSFLWDVVQDWGLGDYKYKFLSKRRMYKPRTVYYLAIAADLVLRFNWVYTLIPPSLGENFLMGLVLPSYLTTFVIFMEILRRTMWGFFRLEHEHLRNTEGYRSVDVVPLHFTTTKAKKETPEPGWGVIGEVVGVGLAAVLVSAVAAITAIEESGSA